MGRDRPALAERDAPDAADASDAEASDASGLGLSKQEREIAATACDNQNPTPMSHVESIRINFEALF